MLSNTARASDVSIYESTDQREKAVRVPLTSVFILCAISNLAPAQNTKMQFRSRVSNDTQQVASGVSQDLLDIYAETKTANTEQAVTAIARTCSKIIPSPSRSKIDREYASSLLAWALNRRGELRSERAAKLVEQGQFAEADKLDGQAAEDFETAIDYGPSNWRTHHNYAISLAMKGEYQKSIAEFTSSIKLNADYANSYFNRGELYFETEQYGQAIEDYSKAIALDLEDPQYYNSRAHCRFMVEDYASALEDYQTAAKLAEDSATYYTDLADAHQFLGNWKDAASAYRMAVSVNGKFPRAYQNAAWLMATCPDESIRNTELALAASKKAIELEGKRSARGVDTLAAATASAGQMDQAMKLQREALALASDDERQELSQRLQLYQRGEVYRQPRPMASVAGQDHSGQFKIRTASSESSDTNSSGTKRSR